MTSISCYRPERVTTGARQAGATNPKSTTKTGNVTDSDPDPAAAGTGENLPFLTGDLPGIGGTLKSVPEDFVVDEIPAYEPGGEGEHLFLRIEKRGVSAEQLTRHVAETLGVSQRDVGVAGLKDRQAVTRQFLSVPATCEDRIAAIETDSIRVLDAQRHRNKLKTGHLRGNRFEVVVRDVGDDALDRANAICRRLARHGFPNYFGAQRFGHDNRTLNTGLQLLRGEITQKKLPFKRRRFLLRLSLSAAQSSLFNNVLAERVRDRFAARVLPGDVMQVTETGGLFVVEDVATEQLRFDAGETAVTGPLFGPKMKQPAAEAAQRELAVLAETGLTLDDFRRYAKLTPGTRRPLLVRPAHLAVEEVDGAIRVRVELPAGVYATVLLREVMKDDRTG